ncbi:DMT family transporter [Bovifimicola ammoniilytica]|jgi:drug/metabolite transporter (DMT)-like permease|uniref:DMT family transporter n=1 Tax=Bovifimicola ammoniilytica TaxID=2981720 RepID=UPI000822EF20|nr:Predicted permease%2C DMT superfamily [uncultured Eubacterium sp.]
MKMSQKNQGIMYIIMAAFFFACMSFFIRKAGDLPTMQKGFFRNVVAMFAAAVMLLRTEDKFKIKKGSIPSLLMRAICGTIGLICNYYAIDHMNISDANILNKLAPFFAIIMSALILNEYANRFEWSMVIVAFIGALFVVKPTLDMKCIPAVVAAIGGLGAGTAYTFVRKLGKQGERGPVIVMFFSTFSCIITLPFVIFDFHPMTLMQLIYLLIAGICAAAGQFTVTQAYAKAPAKDISVFDYSQVLFAAILGFLFLNQIPDIYSIIGYIIIIGAAIIKWIHRD